MDYIDTFPLINEQKLLCINSNVFSFLQKSNQLFALYIGVNTEIENKEALE